LDMNSNKETDAGQKQPGKISNPPGATVKLPNVMASLPKLGDMMGHQKFLEESKKALATPLNVMSKPKEDFPPSSTAPRSKLFADLPRVPTLTPIEFDSKKTQEDNLTKEQDAADKKNPRTSVEALAAMA